MLSPFRCKVAELWHQCSKLKRSDIFGTDDPLRPKYDGQSKLVSQIDVTAVGMVGINYRPGGLVILSVNPAGGKSTSKTNLNSDKMYERFQDLQQSGSRKQKLENFEKANDAVIRSIEDWGITKRYLNEILDSARKNFHEVSYLYVIPFRTKCDEGSRIAEKYIQNGYEKHLKKQLDLLAPRTIIAMDRHSERIAKCFKTSANRKTCVMYYTRKRSTDNERKKVLQKLQEPRRCRSIFVKFLHCCRNLDFHR